MATCDLFSQRISVPVAFNGIAFDNGNFHYDYFYIKNLATTPGYKITIWIGDYTVPDSYFDLGPGESIELPRGAIRVLLASDVNGPHDALVITTHPDYLVL